MSKMDDRSFGYIMDRDEENRSVLNPSKVFNYDWVGEYQTRVDAIGWQISKMNSYRFIVEKIATFPWELFWESGRDFWILTIESMFDTIVLIINKICLDKRKEALTIPRLKDEILKHFISEENRNQFEVRLNSFEFERRLAAVSQFIKNQRDNRIAHFNKEWNTKRLDDDLSMKRHIMSSLSSTCLDITEMYNCIRIGDGWRTTLGSYGSDVTPGVGQDPRSDIEILLDYEAARNSMINLAEKNDYLWEHQRKKLSTEQIQILNNYRKKSNLPPV